MGVDDFIPFSVQNYEERRELWNSVNAEERWELFADALDRIRIAEEMIETLKAMREHSVRLYSEAMIALEDTRTEIMQVSSHIGEAIWRGRGGEDAGRREPPP